MTIHSHPDPALGPVWERESDGKRFYVDEGFIVTDCVTAEVQRVDDLHPDRWQLVPQGEVTWPAKVDHDWRKSKCPDCGAKAVSRFCDIIDFECGYNDLEAGVTDTCKLNQIIALTSEYGDPAKMGRRNANAHAIASAVLKIAKGEA